MGVPNLESLTLDLTDNHVSDAGAAALGGLKDAQALRGLSLCLKSNRITAAGAQALASATRIPSLQVDLITWKYLPLDSCNHVARNPDHSAQAQALCHSLAYVHTLGVRCRIATDSLERCSTTCCRPIGIPHSCGHGEQ